MPLHGTRDDLEGFGVKKRPLTLNKLAVFFKWYHQESNRGHKDFQSFALKTSKSCRFRRQPTELWHFILSKSCANSLLIFCGLTHGLTRGYSEIGVVNMLIISM